MANPGYGKRTTPGQHPRKAHDFTGLLPREAAIAAYIDRLPEGADISVKTLAKELPYGQCALRTALNRLQDAGHLRRGREHLTAESGSSRWITRSWWSRTARNDSWWARFTRGDVPQEPEQEPELSRGPEPSRTPGTAPTRRRAHILLAALGRETPALSLSEADCAALAPLLLPWFERGASDETVRHALTSGLPTPVHSPVAILRTRLISKLPPEQAPAPDPVRPPLRMLECAKCRTPGRPEALPGGTCATCRGERAPARDNAPLSAAEVHTHAAQIRAAMSRQPRERTPV
ncbi:hypothetical protein ABT147_17640 [Streptomyces sp. NPDC001868]|uniref:hypothetical protein n=1 Tax=Streptomyces sp. NPDC001868 TaxID=3154401 RepID=UPI00332392DE